MEPNTPLPRRRTLSASEVRRNVYRLLDEVLATGQPVEILRKGKRLRIVPVESVGRLDRLVSRPFLAVEPEELVHLDWSAEWRP
jgi:antitoxin (DNA-binding transcriptional repressor) of toxin-antitoxin stability system